MAKKNQANNDSGDPDSGNNNSGSLGHLQGVCIAALWVFIALSLVAIFWPNLSERTKFFTGNFFNLLIAFAVIAQVLIYRKQWDVMERSLMIGSRASVGIRSIRMDREAKTVLVEIENIGKVPADQMTLFLQLFMIKNLQREDGEWVQKVKRSSVTEDYGRTKLFKGNLPIVLAFYLQAELTEDEVRLIHDGTIGLILRGYIKYADGFSAEPSDRTEFYFDYLSELDVWSAGPADYGDIIGDEDSDWDDD